MILANNSKRSAKKAGFLTVRYLMLNSTTKLIWIKSVHTSIWVFFNIVIFYMLYAAVFNKIGRLFWIGCVFIAIEIIVLLVFKFACPLTNVARKYSDSTKHNFDIYLPNWLARYNKLIYGVILTIIFIITANIYFKFFRFD